MQDSIQFSPSPAEREKEAQKYHKIKVLGQGSMGRAYLVESAEDKLFYVMKRINLGHLGQKERDDALRQAQLHSLLSHPNIVQFKQLYQTTGQKLCIVMQYAEGGDLQEYITSQAGKLMSEQTVLTIFSQICLGLQEVHSKRVIHRDLKTANIFLTKDRQVKLGDFGISRTLDKTQLAATSMIGTPYYLSPQMVEGKPYSTKADIWALGVILYQLCSYKLPFQANSLPVLALKIMKGSFPPIPNQYSKDLKALLLSMLQVDQKKRPTVQAILTKPYIYKLLPKEQQQKIIQKQQQRQHLKKQKQKMEKAQKGQPKDNKQKLRRQKQQKREEMRKQMRQDLKKKRADTQKEYESTKPAHNQSNNTITVPQTVRPLKKSPRKDAIMTPKVDVTKAVKKEQPIKPWKNKKPGQKKDITIQVFVPENKIKEPPKQDESLQDFKVQIFVSKRPEQFQPFPSITQFPKKQSKEEKQQEGRKSMPLIGQKVSNYHYNETRYQQESQKDESYENQQYEEESIEEEDQLHELMNKIKNVGEMARQLPEPTRQICLYEESQNFDSTVQVTAQQPRKEELDNLKQLLSSQSLEELRLILEERLGDHRFLEAYSVVKKHLDDYFELLENNQSLRPQLKQSYIFNRQLLKGKLPFLTQQQFESNIELLFTLLIYQELQMQKNEQDGMRQSKYQKLL